MPNYTIQKELSTSLQNKVDCTSRQLCDLQALSNNTNNEFSKAITSLQEKNSALDARCEKLLVQLDSVKSEMGGYESDAKIHSQEMGALRKDIKSKEEEICSLRAELLECEKRSAESRASAVSAEARRDEAGHSLRELHKKFDAYRLEMDAQVESLKKEIHGQKILSEKLTLTETALGAANDELSSRKEELDKALTSFQDLRVESSLLQKAMETSLSTLSINLLDKSKGEQMTLENMEQGLRGLREDLASMEEKNRRSHLASRDKLGCIQDTCTAIQKQQERAVEMAGAATSTADGYVMRESARSSSGEEEAHAPAGEALDASQSLDSATTRSSSADDIVDGCISEALGLAIKEQ